MLPNTPSITANATTKFHPASVHFQINNLLFLLVTVVGLEISLSRKRKILYLEKPFKFLGSGWISVR